MLRVDRNRLDGSAALPGLRTENVSVRGDEAMLELWLSAEHDIELYFPAPAGVVRSEWLAVANDVLSWLAELDNAVQHSCAEECIKSGLHSRHYESYLVYITLLDRDTIALHYSGAVVNTEWDECFVRTEGQWIAKPA